MRSIIFDCSGPNLTDPERRFFRNADPLGFILFARHCNTPDQVRGLIAELRACVGRADAPVLIDQEGGRVQRLGPPHWPAYPSAARFGELYVHNPDKAIEAARLSAFLMAADLTELGITVDCAPVLDVPQPGADAIIGDRAYGNDPAQVAALGMAVCEGLLDGGVLPVIKHVPGHGRANVDSHKALPVVEAPLDQLEAVDFAPFRALNSMPLAMTAHVVYGALDQDHPATTSAKVIREVIREKIGFDGILLSDDLYMEALEGDYRTRAEASLGAGCDLVIQCNSDLKEMEAAASGCGEVSASTLDRLKKADALRRDSGDTDPNEVRRRLEELMERVI